MGREERDVLSLYQSGEKVGWGQEIDGYPDTIDNLSWISGPSKTHIQ
jgi:hypothetical protein